MFWRTISKCLAGQQTRIATAMVFLILTSPTLVFGKTESGPGASKRGRVIDFEDEVVEGLNRRPLDSLSQISERDKKRKKVHLYRKRGGFRPETAETMRVLKFVP